MSCEALTKQLKPCRNKKLEDLKYCYVHRHLQPEDSQIEPIVESVEIRLEPPIVEPPIVEPPLVEPPTV